MSDLVERMRARLRTEGSNHESRDNGRDSGQGADSGNKCITGYDSISSADSSVGQDWIAGFGAADFESARANLRILQCPTDFESCKTSLRLAAYITVRSGVYARKPIDGGVSFVVHSLVGPESCERWFSSYCVEPYPDMCSCGQMFLSNAGQLRDHCIVCKGYSPDCHAMDMKWRFARYREGIRVNLGIHKSWADYSVAWALYHKANVGGAKR